MPEQKRRRDARHAKDAVAKGLVESRKPLLPAEASAMFRAVDAKVFNLFGIRRLVTLELDLLHEAPEAVTWTRHITLIDYAAWRGGGREGVVQALLNAGADPTDGVVPVANLAHLSRPYAVWLARAAARMRQLGALALSESGQTGTKLPLAPCACGTSSTLVFSPCKHACCASCAWEPFRGGSNEDFSRRPILKCPVCSVRYADAFVDSAREATRRAGRVLPGGHFPDDWRCEMCIYFNRALWSECRNCGQEKYSPPSTDRCYMSAWTLLDKFTHVKFQCTGLIFLHISMLLLPSVLANRSGLSYLRRARRFGLFAECGVGALTLLMFALNQKPFSEFLSRLFQRMPSTSSCSLDIEEQDTHARRQKRRSESLERWIALPEVPPPRSEMRKMNRQKETALNADADAAARLGITRAQRCIHLQRAAERGDVCRVRAVLEAGVDIDVENEYGQSPLFLAAWAGRAEVVTELASWGADLAKACNGGATAATAASAARHDTVLSVLANASQGAHSGIHCPWLCKAAVGTKANLTILPKLPACTGSAFYIDDAFDEEFLDNLEELWRSLPVAGREDDPNKTRSDFERSVAVTDRSRQSAAPRRSYFCDVDGWLASALTQALCSVGAPALNGKCGHGHGGQELGKTFAHMRFLHYADEGGFLAAHTDLSRTDCCGLKSTHTFILYLRGVGDGGNTVLLESLSASSPAVATVEPVRGRLFVFPHVCPHRADAVTAPPKLLLRGEMC